MEKQPKKFQFARTTTAEFKRAAKKKPAQKKRKNGDKDSLSVAIMGAI